MLQIWAYGAIAGLTIFLVLLIAIIYLTYSACRRAKLRQKSPQIYNTYGSYSSQRSTTTKQHQRRTGSCSGSNVGVGLVVNGNNTCGSSYYGTGGQGLPPYYSTAPAPSIHSHHSIPPAPSSSSHASHSRSHSTATAPRFPSLQSRTPSARSGFSFPDRYDSNEGFVWLPNYCCYLYFPSLCFLFSFCILV